jgi:hypothetical protein
MIWRTSLWVSGSLASHPSSARLRATGTGSVPATPSMIFVYFFSPCAPSGPHPPRRDPMLPSGLIIAWASCVTIATTGDHQHEVAVAHIVFISVFGAARLLHTILYTLSIFRARSLVWLTGLLCTIGMAANCIAASFLDK